MKFEKIVFILGILGVLVISLICFYEDKPLRGEVESVEFGEGRVTIKLVGQEERLVVFSDILNLKEGDKVLFWGKKEVYRGEEQIIVEKLERIKR
ncbi:MAG: hypothetical protein WC494_02645 [Candidatus Pacearchaeota archaeon]